MWSVNYVWNSGRERKGEHKVLSNTTWCPSVCLAALHCVCSQLRPRAEEQKCVRDWQTDWRDRQRDSGMQTHKGNRGFCTVRLKEKLHNICSPYEKYSRFCRFLLYIVFLLCLLCWFRILNQSGFNETFINNKLSTYTLILVV